MFAIIKSGAKQYKVSAGERVLVEKLQPPEGENIEFKDVLLISDGATVHVGRPMVENAVVSGVSEGNERGEKLYPLKKKRRKNYRRRIGHRQTMSAVRITEIKV